MGRLSALSDVCSHQGGPVGEGKVVPGGQEKPGAQPGATDLSGFGPAPAGELGSWRLTGEICDGKCGAGALRPGSGLAHKACANLCISTRLPPVLVRELPAEGTRVVLLAAGDGGPMPDPPPDMTAAPLRLDGQPERRDDPMIFRIDESTVRRAWSNRP